MDMNDYENGGNFAFFPTSNLEGKNNYKQYYFITRDGQMQKRVFLDVLDDRQREFIICIHYLMWTGKLFLKEGDGIDILGRDCPWDFSLSINKTEHFFLEITAIADNSEQHIVNKREQRAALNRSHKDIKLRELKKLNAMFPLHETSEEILRHQEAGITDDQKVSNPWFGDEMRLFLSSIPSPDKSLLEIIQSAIMGKIDKKHEGKQETVLVLDNRTSLFDANDVIAAAKGLETFFVACPFREIWFYTGYFSDHDGQNSEYSNIAFKLPPDRQAKLLQAAEKLPIDERGRTIMPPSG
ncbi:hypothetical protein [Agrobacterium cavarae]